MRGASRGVLEVGQVRRPRAGFVTPHSGGPGTRSGGIRTAPPGARLDWDWHSASSQETRTRGQKSPQWSAEGRPSARAKRKGHASQACRAAAPAAQGASQAPASLGAPLPSLGAKGRPRHDGVPRAAKNRGDGACPFGPLRQRIPLMAVFRVALTLRFWLYPRASRSG